ncbi:hypothetical protein [Halobacteriovorax sp. HLS]|uniref:hypothetical protein n=1 Tax=Halobacteriovorax sp. HLS TaxID=2234000 RepID=UPI000FD82123|nr:hypothetical protein [Halobacteriovorax sp. HLS]
MKVLEGKYFGNLTVKGIKEVSLDYDFSFFPIAWGWYILFLIGLFFLLAKYFKRKRFEKENRYILDYIEYINTNEVNLYELSKILHITHKKKRITKEDRDSFYQTEFGKSISRYLYQNTIMPCEEFTDFKNAVVVWLRKRYL